MQIITNKKDGGNLELAFELSQDEVLKIQTQAAVNLSTDKSIPGFRPGKAPYDLVKKYLGAEVVKEELLLAVKKYYLPHIVENEIEVVGRPKVDMVSESPFQFKVVGELFPTVDLGKWEKVKVTKKEVVVSDAKVEKVVDDLRGSRATEALADKAAAMGDKITLDFQVAVDNVVIDGGAAKDYSMIVGKGQMVPGFEDNLVGLKAGEKKKFNLTFPAQYHKNLAGREAEVNVTIKSVFNRVLPELNDDFAKGLGQFKTFKELKEKLGENLLEEGKVEEENRVEREMFEQMLKGASFSTIPKFLIDSEIEQMIAEFSHGITHQGIKFDEYLLSLKKTVDDLKKEFIQPATKRIQVALMIKEIGKEQKLEATDGEVQEDINKALEYHNHDEIIKAKVETADYRERIKNFLTNKKVVDWIKSKLVK